MKKNNCIHLGDPTGCRATIDKKGNLCIVARKTCGACKTHFCSHPEHGPLTILAKCRKCPGYQPPEAEK
jgi:hypothetical protein